MRSETVRKEDLSRVEWDDSYFKYCEFDEFDLEGNIACSDFVSCTFNKIDWYWGFFSGANFIRCRFVDCVFRGCSFGDARFVDCELTRCQFVNDNLGGACNFDGAAAYGCTLLETAGFDPATVRG